MANLQNVVLTPKADQSVKTISVPSSEFSTTSTTFVDVTGVNLSVPVGFFAGVNYAMKTAGANVKGRIRLVTTGSATAETSRNELSYGRFASGVLKNSSGGADTAHLQVRTDNGAQTAFIQASTAVIVAMPFQNSSDRFFKANVTEIKILTIQSGSEGIEGVNSSQNDQDIVTLTINAIMDRFVFSANSGKVLWDWTGSSIEVS